MSLRITAFLLLMALLLAGYGCGGPSIEVIDETDEKQYQLAKDYQKQGRVDEALSAYLRVIDKRRDAPESHLEAGYIYLKEMKDPIRAIYHFDRYLQFSPNSPQAAQVRQLRETAEKDFARGLPAQPYEGQLERLDLLELVEGLREENIRLKRELVAAQQQLGSGPTTASNDSNAAAVSRTTRQQAQAQAQGQPSGTPDTYTVQAGDTLSSISRKMYGTPSRWMDIFQANRDRLASQNALRVGQELRIP